jgi:PAS domain S-box-containing protein
MTRTRHKAGTGLDENIDELRRRLDEAEETLRAIREGEVDAIVVSGKRGDLVYSLSGAEQIYRLIVETMREAALTVALDGTILFCNHQFSQFLGLPQEKILGHALGEFVDPAQAFSLPGLIARSKRESVKQRLVFRSEGQPPVPAHISANVLNQPDGVSICIVATNLTELETSAEMLRRTNRILQMLSDCNQAIVRIEDEQDLMWRVCNIIVTIGHFRMALVAMKQEDREKSICPVVSFVALNEGSLSETTWADDRNGRGPIATALRTGQIQTAGDYLTEPHLAPWRREARRQGCRSAVAMPLKDGARVFGVLVVFSEVPYAFGDSGAGVLAELAENLAFGITALRTRRALHDSRDRLRALAGELTLTERRERQRLSKILHDHIQQLLVGAKYRLHAIPPSGNDASRSVVREIEQLLNECIGNSRTLTAELSPPILHEGRLCDTLEWLAEWMEDKHGLTVDLDLQVESEAVPQDLKLLLFESTKELLFNIVKHAGVKSATLGLRRLGENGLQVEIADRGVGFDPQALDAAGSKGGFGLFSIRHRMELIGGRLEIASGTGEGTRLCLSVPLSAPRSHS